MFVFVEIREPAERRGLWYKTIQSDAFYWRCCK